MSSKVLITGGTGLVGTYLSKKLQNEVYEVVHLSRYKRKTDAYPTYTWDLSKKLIEKKALENIDFVIHLAGAGVADKRWTPERKKVLTSSRVDGANLLFEHFQNNNYKPKAFISASAIGIYGFDTGSIMQTEDRTQLGDDFLATLTKKWEQAADQFNSLNTRVVKLRIGLVLAQNGGMLNKLVPFARYGLSSAFGSGLQYMSWIHIDDLVNMFVKALEDDTMIGAYNAVAPNPVTNKEFIKTLSESLGKPYFLPNTPKFFLQLILGELSSALTGGNKVSAEKMLQSGFQFQFEKLDESLNDLVRK